VISDLGHRPFGVDVSAAGLLHAREISGTNALAAASFTDLPFASGIFDGAIAYGVLYYGGEASYRKGVAELLRVLKRGGFALIVTRSIDDHRFGRGRRLGPTTFELDTDDTNELGMSVHFLDRSGVIEMFSDAADIRIDRLVQTVDGGAVVNADWIVEVER
jgi:SAM-dependent methyltransferase